MFRFFQLPNHASNFKQLDTHTLLYYGEFPSCLAKAYIESWFIRHGGAETSQENLKEIWMILNPSIQQPQHRLETLILISRWPKRERTPELLSLGCCGFHVLHGVWNTAQKRTDWNLYKPHKNCFGIFKELSARRAD